MAISQNLPPSCRRWGPFLAVFAALASCALPASAAAQAAAGGACTLPSQLAEQLLAGQQTEGDLPVTASFVIDEKVLLEEGRTQATVEAVLEPGTLLQNPQGELCFFLLLDTDGEALLGHQYRFAARDLTTVESLRYVTRLDLPQGTRQMTAIFREAASGLWGAAPIESPAESVAGPGLAAIRVPEREGTYFEVKTRRVQAGSAAAAGPAASVPATGTPPAAKSGATPAQTPGAGTAAPAPPATPPATPPAAARPGRSKAAGKPAGRNEVIIRLIPPRDQPVTGSTVFNCLVTSEAVDKVVYELDGKVVEERKRPPFRTRIDLASPAREHTVKVTAYDASGQVMGVDSARINAKDLPFRTRINRVDGDPAAGRVEVEATVNLPPGGRLAKVEFFRNEELVGTLTAPPFAATIPTPDLQPDDYVRVAATLEDGESIEDVVLLATRSLSEEVEVNLAELHVVVTDAEGRPLTDLRADEFRLVIGGKPEAPQGFANAQEVPLVLGLIVDSSGSMQLLMHDTRKAAAKFLGRTISPKDQAFLIDFDIKPRLLRPVTGDLRQLMIDLQKINADGRTAMYDAVVFGLLQFQEARGRRALVILSDGDDLDSKFGPAQAAEMAREAGALVYVIGLGALDDQPRTYSKSDLRKVSEGTGGRLFFVDSFEQLDEAYEIINRELRSQYTLTFYTKDDLTDAQKRAIKVEVPGRKGVQVRAVLGAGSTF